MKVGAIALRVHVMIMPSSITAYFPKLSNMTVTNKLDMTSDIILGTPRLVPLGRPASRN